MITCHWKWWDNMIIISIDVTGWVYGHKIDVYLQQHNKQLLNPKVIKNPPLNLQFPTKNKQLLYVLMLISDFLTLNMRRTFQECWSSGSCFSHSMKVNLVYLAFYWRLKWRNHIQNHFILLNSIRKQFSLLICVNIWIIRSSFVFYRVEHSFWSLIRCRWERQRGRQLDRCYSRIISQQPLWTFLWFIIMCFLLQKYFIFVNLI